MSTNEVSASIMSVTEHEIHEMSAQELLACREELLSLARKLDHHNQKFSRFMSLQLQQLELAVDHFERERDAWWRQRERESTATEDVSKESDSPGPQRTLTSLADLIESRHPGFRSSSKTEMESYTLAPLRVIIEPGSATAMQIGLLLFEISKFNRELGGGGARFEVSSTRLGRMSGQKASRSQTVIGLEAFSFLPLLDYEGEPSRFAEPWSVFKAELLMSSLTDQNVARRFARATPAPRDHEAHAKILEATRRAENANNKCEIVSTSKVPSRIGGKQKPKNSPDQQLKRIADVLRYLKSECDFRIHVSLVW